MSKKISTLPSGALVKMNENGVPKKFIFLEYNHYGKGESVLLRKDTFASRQWTSSYMACTSGSYCTNDYNGCGIDMFCNTQYPMMLDPVIRACLVNVMLPTYYKSSIVNFMRSCFLLSANEAAGTDSGMSDGSVFSYLSTQANRIAYYDETSTAMGWWLRSSVSNDSQSVAYVCTDGRYSYSKMYSASFEKSPRPALALSSEILVSNTTDSSGCYIIESTPAGEQYQKVNGVWLRMC